MQAMVLRRDVCWHCAPHGEHWRFETHARCARCADDQDERPTRYTPGMVAAVIRDMQTAERAGHISVAATDIKEAWAALDRAGRLSNLEKNVLRERLFFGFSEARVAHLLDRDPATIARACRSVTRKIAVWLESPTHGLHAGYYRLLYRIFEPGS